MGVNRDGVRAVPGLWIADNEGARFQLSVISEPESCGGQHVLIAAGNGRKGFPEAITAAFPEKAIVRACIVYPMRHAVNVYA